MIQEKIFFIVDSPRLIAQALSLILNDSESGYYLFRCFEQFMALLVNSSLKSQSLGGDIEYSGSCNAKWLPKGFTDVHNTVHLVYRPNLLLWEPRPNEAMVEPIRNQNPEMWKDVVAKPRFRSGA